MARYITIEREFGSGGRIIADMLAKECNIKCYGKEVLEKAATILNLPVYDLEKYEEKTRNKFLYSMSLMGKTQDRNADLLLKDGHLFVAEQQAIKEFAGFGSCIFLGHCASEALKDYDDVISVFVKGSIESRRNRVRDVYGISEDKVDAIIKKFDKNRSSYYSVNTNNKWHDLNKYDIVLDTSKLSIEACVLMLKELYLKNK